MWGGISQQFWISLITDVEHLFVYLLAAVCMSSLKKYLFSSFACYLIGLFIFLLLSFRDSLHILNINSLWDTWFANISSCSTGCLFTPLVTVFCIQIFKFLQSPVFFFFFSFVACAFRVIYKKSLPNPVLWSFCPMVSSKSFTVLGLIFRSLIYLELIFTCGIW